MAEVVVVGAGVAGMAAAARLAKRGHRVVVCERQARAGGIVQRIELDGFGWDAGPSSVTLPAVLRDLFRKSGRPLERYVDLRMCDVARRHVFADSSYVDLPTGSRGAQTRAIDHALGAGSGQAWTKFVDAQAAAWELLRRDVLDDPAGGERLRERALARRLSSATSLATLISRSLGDERLRLMAAHPFAVAGSDPRQVPSWGAVEVYVERTFGVWEAAGGLANLTTALTTRLSERGVELRLGCTVDEVVTHDGAVAGIRTADDENIACDVVVAAIDPRVVLGRLVDRRLVANARRAFATAKTAMPPAVTHLGLRGELPSVPSEVVFHGDPSLVLAARGSAPADHHAWTVQSIGHTVHDNADVLDVLADRGLDLRPQVVTRVDRSPDELVATNGGSPYGLLWSGWRDHARRAGSLNPIPGLYLVGASTHPGASVPYAAWGAANAAARIDSAF